MGVRTSVLSVSLLVLAGCPSDSSEEESSTGTTTMDSNGPGTTDSATTQPQPSTGSDATPGTGTGSAETTQGESESGTTGPSLGCTPGDPCCNDAGEFEECWIDQENDLVWELDPQGGNPNITGAATYCDNLTLAGSGGWRLPTISELRTLVRACADTQTDGACGLTDDCSSTDCRDDTCDGCIDAPNEGPGLFGCYWDPNLLGSCDRYWSSTDPGGGLGWLLDFEDASMRQADATLPAGRVRCVAQVG